MGSAAIGQETMVAQVKPEGRVTLPSPDQDQKEVIGELRWTNSRDLSSPSLAYLQP